MTRQIKFRAWVESVSKMLDWEYLKYKSDIGAVISGGYDGYHPMQFTGLLDKNGKEIYDGDVVKCDWLGNNDNQDQWLQTEVVYMGAGFYLHGKALNTFSKESIEIIGNIYENPELINN